MLLARLGSQHMVQGFPSVWGASLEGGGVSSAMETTPESCLSLLTVGLQFETCPSNLVWKKSSSGVLAGHRKDLLVSPDQTALETRGVRR